MHFYSWGNWVSEGLNNLPKGTYRVNTGAGVQSLTPETHILNPFISVKKILQVE